MNKFDSFFDVRSNKRELLLELRVTFPSRANGLVEEDVRRLVLVADKIDNAQGNESTFFDVQAQSIGFNRVVNFDLGVAVFAVKQLKEKGSVVSARWG